MKSFLVIAAAKFEVQPTLDLFESRGIKYRFHELGMGSISAAREASALGRESQEYSELVYIGTCGIFGSFANVEIVMPSSVDYSDVGERYGLAYTIDGQYPSCRLPERDESFFLNLRRVHGVSSGGITLESDRWPEIQAPVRLDIVENLELYGAGPSLMAEAIHRRVTILLGVTNSVGRSAHEQWKANFQSAAMKTAEILGAYIDTY